MKKDYVICSILAVVVSATTVFLIIKMAKQKVEKTLGLKLPL